MKKEQVKLGKRYCAKVSGQIAVVRLLKESPYGGWDAVNEDTGRSVRIKTAARLRYEIPDMQKKPTLANRKSPFGIGS